MKYTEYERIAEMVVVYDQYCSDFKVLDLGTSEGGFIQGLYDGKSNCLYVEQYNSGSLQFELHKFNQGDIPTTWELDSAGGEIVDIVI